MRTQHCGYWCPGAKAPGHQYPQCWPNINCTGPISNKNMIFVVNKVENYIISLNDAVFDGFNSIRTLHYRPNMWSLRYPQTSIWVRVPMGSVIKTCVFYEKTFWREKGKNNVCHFKWNTKLCLVWITHRSLNYIISVSSVFSYLCFLEYAVVNQHKR